MTSENPWFMPFEPSMKIENLDLTARVFRHIRDDITAGKYPQGTALQLPQLSRQLGVSQTPIREALLRLAEKEYLEKTASRSYVIRSITKQQFFRLSEVRADVETKIIGQMIDEATPFDIEAMSHIYDMQSEALLSGDYEQSLILNREFHGHYLKLSNIPQVSEFVENICVIVGPLLHGLKENRISKEKDQHFHSQILDAIRRNDRNSATKAMYDDVMVNAERICSMMH